MLRAHASALNQDGFSKIEVDFYVFVGFQDKKMFTPLYSILWRII